ncbi:MAG: hypothetical protein ACYTG5_10725 [Planctomycetota bacterium]|jgi:hypothetical protein
MIPRILSHIVFWLLMTFIILGSTLVVLLLYLPFVGAKAVFMAVGGKLSQKPDGTALPSAGKG